MSRNILLLEPNYKNKYPPVGLMKISTYHKNLGDKVTFFKGDINSLLISQIADKCVIKLGKIDAGIDWSKYLDPIKKYIKQKNKVNLDSIPISGSKYEILLFHALSDYSDFYRKKLYKHDAMFDRIYVATLFTFYWDITIKTILFAKELVSKTSDVFVGGVMASLIPEEIEKATQIKPIKGLLDKPGMLDKGNKTIIDELPLDYSILDEIDYEYPTQSAYFTFMTKGCTRTCAFCSVPKIEPTYKPYIHTKTKYEVIKKVYGEQQNLLLMDNNILASPNFPEIIKEIKEMGFYKGATYREPNQLDISVTNLKKGLNDIAYVKRSFKLMQSILKKIKNTDKAQYYYDMLDKYDLLDLSIATKDNILTAYPYIKDIYDKYRIKAPKSKWVDFNQGVDCRYINEHNMSLISEIPVRPLRIAFDYLSIKDKYIKAVKLAAKYGIKELSNYILYNFVDKPEDLYERLKINVELDETLGINIYSFPMKYIPLFGEESKNREFVGKFWNRKYIRSIQAILNVTKGIVAPGRSFFEKAFGRNLDEFNELLYMPEPYIIYRKIYENNGSTEEWRRSFKSLSTKEQNEAKLIIHDNEYTFLEEKTRNKKILKLLEHYRTDSSNIKEDSETKKIKKNISNLIKQDRFIDLTLTYDFDDSLDIHGSAN